VAVVRADELQQDRAARARELEVDLQAEAGVVRGEQPDVGAVRGAERDDLARERRGGASRRGGAA